MTTFNKKEHWENLFQTKELSEVSWYQLVPTTSLEYVKQFNLPLSAKIIDVGGGDSFLVDYLIEMGYTNISVLDISEFAIERAKERLGENAKSVKWIVSDSSKFSPTEKYDFWIDRAAFHFLTDDFDRLNYLKTLSESIEDNGYVVIGTFSMDGPTKCSGIEIKQYSEESLSDLLIPFFKKIECKYVNHTTPFNTIQNFVFCSFQKRD